MHDACLSLCRSTRCSIEPQTPSHPRPSHAPIALLTDFGERDWYVGALRGVIQSIAPQAPVLDITHAIAPGDSRAAAFILSQCWLDFPPGTVFCAVVDPGVGTDRTPVAAHADERTFVGPDNGLLGFLTQAFDGEAAPRWQAHAIRNAYLFRQVVTHTFHGRDLFAPVAAHLAKGTPLEKVGPPHPTLQPPPWSLPTYAPALVRGEVLHVDRYGNVLTNLKVAALRQRYTLGNALHLEPAQTASALFIPLVDTFGSVPLGEPLAYEGSGGFLEIAVNGASAMRQFHLAPGQRIDLVDLNPA
ncbi:MAG: S-adenosyl-l-methionine hydroxide adenosyltransferase family protein [Opitutales bacterium]